MATSVLLKLRAAQCVLAEDEARLLCERARDQEHLYELVERRIAGEPLEHLIESKVDEVLRRLPS